MIIEIHLEANKIFMIILLYSKSNKNKTYIYLCKESLRPPSHKVNKKINKQTNKLRVGKLKRRGPRLSICPFGGIRTLLMAR